MMQKGSTKRKTLGSDKKLTQREKPLNEEELNKEIKEYSEKHKILKTDLSENKNRISELEKEIESATKELSEVQKSKENLSHYLFKVESIMKKENNNNNKCKVMTFRNNKNDYLNDPSQDNASESSSSNYEVFNSQSLTINITGATPNIILNDSLGNKIIIQSKSDLMKFLNKLYKENQSLKNFQNQVFNLSKSYDDINNSLAESISSFQDFCKNKTSTKNLNDDVSQKLSELNQQIQKSLETKQNEYNMLLEKKDEELSLLKSEFTNLEEEINIKKDRLPNQKIIMDLYDQIDILEDKCSRLQEKEKNQEEAKDDN